MTNLYFVFKNENIALKNIWLLISQDLNSFTNTTCVTYSKLKVYSKYSKSKVAKNVFNPYELYQNTQNWKSLFHQIFIVYKTFTLGIKTNTSQKDEVFH